jgi:hypothetical protein
VFVIGPSIFLVGFKETRHLLTIESVVLVNVGLRRLRDRGQTQGLTRHVQEFAIARNRQVPLAPNVRERRLELARDHGENPRLEDGQDVRIAKKIHGDNIDSLGQGELDETFPLFQIQLFLRFARQEQLGHAADVKNNRPLGSLLFQCLDHGLFGRRNQIKDSHCAVGLGGMKG